ncbi:TNF receptor-associated factor 6-like isoform X1 [Daktulosphaira vitifoliae]|uniref:TNF receptor-associated factor 6-like isoform X1 n=1 Tax=Daktulosphaira vitifoliae TaxID=58002 RepID=UPI0021AA3068|nr:TNF receptor-associated factor 6-like isoform X1 [Daktulosphaira vitifoliae]
MSQFFFSHFTMFLTVIFNCRLVAQQSIKLDDFIGGNLTNNKFDTNDAAVDTQYASCKIITDRIVATAEGKFSRFCHGICNINETNSKLSQIESLLSNNFDEIKQRILLIEKYFSNGNHYINLNKHSLAENSCDHRRQLEVDKYNSTVFLDNQKQRTFVYYWKVRHFWRIVFVDSFAHSPPFYISTRSYRLQLSIESNVTAHTILVTAALVQGEYNANLTWPFSTRLRLSVLDQTDVRPEDIVSYERYDTGVYDQPKGDERKTICSSIEFHRDVLAYRQYVVDDNLLVKLTVFS